MSQESNTVPVPVQRPRDVYLADVLINGMRAYYAMTSWGLMLGPLTVDTRYFTDTEVMEHLEDVLEFVDPVRPRLTLLPSHAADQTSSPAPGPASRPVPRLALVPSLCHRRERRPAREGA